MGTIIPDDMLKDLVRQYEGAGAVKVELIRESADNVVYLVDSGEKKVLRISKRLPAADLEYEHGIIEYLAKNDFPVPRWNRTSEGGLFARHGEKIAVLFDFLSGYQVAAYEECPPNENQCHAAGKTLASLHNICSSLSIDSPRERTVFTELERGLAKRSLLKDRFEGGAEFIERVEAMIEFGRQDGGATGLIHNDYRPGNLFFRNDDEVSGVIDFDWCCDGPLVKDLALAALEWSFPDSRTEPNMKLFDSFIAGYNSVAITQHKKGPSLYRWVCFAALSDASTYFCDLADEPAIGETKLRSYMYDKFKLFSDLS